MGVDAATLPTLRWRQQRVLLREERRCLIARSRVAAVTMMPDYATRDGAREKV